MRFCGTPPPKPIATLRVPDCGRGRLPAYRTRTVAPPNTPGRTEAIWDYIGGQLLRLPDAGVALDRVIKRVVPAPLVAELDESMNLLGEIPRLDDDQADPFAGTRRG